MLLQQPQQLSNSTIAKDRLPPRLQCLPGYFMGFLRSRVKLRPSSQEMATLHGQRVGRGTGF